MRRLAPLMLVIGLIAAGCGDSATTTTTAAAGTTTTTAAATTTTTAAATTTTAAETTTTAAGSDALVAAQAMAGHWTGAWHNTTFGSTGSIDAVIEVDADAMTVTVTSDLGGNVFGGSDPDPVTTVIDLAEVGALEGTDPLLGDYTMEVGEDGSFTLMAPSVPGLGMMFEMEGTIDPTGMNLTYQLTQPNGTVYAEGTMEISPEA